MHEEENISSFKFLCEVELNLLIYQAPFWSFSFETRDSVIILTAKYNLAVVSWDPSRNTVITRAHGIVQDRVGRECDLGPVVTVHSSGVWSVLRQFMKNAINSADCTASVRRLPENSGLAPGEGAQMLQRAVRGSHGHRCLFHEFGYVFFFLYSFSIIRISC